MDYHQHRSNNHVLGAPKGWDQKALPCGALPCTVFEDRIASYWRPSAEELAALNAGKSVVLEIFGRAHPPVAVGVEA